MGKFVGLDFAHFGSLRPYGSILSKLHDMFHYEDDNVYSVLTVRVEQLYFDIILPEKVIKKEQLQRMTVHGLVNYRQQTENNLIKVNSRIVPISQSCCLCNELHNLFPFPCAHSFCVKCVLVVVDKTRDKLTITCPTCSQFWGDVNESNRSSSNQETNIGLDDYGHVAQESKIVEKGCGCCKTLHNLFTFPCAHALCKKCVLDNLDMIRKGSASTCLICSLSLKGRDLNKLNEFIDLNLPATSSKIKTKLSLVNLNHMKKSEQPVRDYKQWRSSEHLTPETNKLKDIDWRKPLTIGVDKRQCVFCRTEQNLFAFPCGHEFCIKCVLDGLNKIRVESGSRCPNCFTFLWRTAEIKFNHFIDEKMSNMSGKTINHTHTDTSISKMYLLKASGNEIKIRRCSKCRTVNHLSTIKCTQCYRPLDTLTTLI